MVLTLDVWADVALWGCVSAALASLLDLLGLLPFSIVFLTAWAITSAACILMASLYVSDDALIGMQRKAAVHGPELVGIFLSGQHRGPGMKYKDDTFVCYVAMV